MKKIFLLLIASTTLLLAWCWKTYKLDIESWEITWSPMLRSEMQVTDFDEDNWDLMFQEISKDDNAILDTLIIAYDYENLRGQKIWLSSYVQSSINQLKDLWDFTLSNEKSEKRTVWEYQAILKTYKIKDSSKELYAAQEFIELKNNTVVMLSYTSDESSHTKTFVKELQNLKIN